LCQSDSVGEFAKAINVIRAVDHPVISASENPVATQISRFRLRAGERVKVRKALPAILRRIRASTSIARKADERDKSPVKIGEDP
jgi:hypothetical protein